MDASAKPPDDRRPFRSLPLVQREVALLIMLCVIAVGMFSATYRLASWSRERRVETAALWFARGEQFVQAGSRDAGIAALTEAVAADRQRATYVLALAHALADAGRNDQARQLLIQLRQTQPDDVEVNYRLARLASAAGDAAEATRYYNHAMYGLVRIGGDYDRRQIRTELIAFLLNRHDRQEALTELNALGRELPNDPTAYLQAAHLADQAGDAKLALQYYQRAARLDPASAEAAAGAGEAAFALQDFATAVRDLQQAMMLGNSTPGLEAHHEMAELVLSADPIGPRIATRERVRRVLLGLARAADRFDACLPTSQLEPQTNDSDRREIEHLERSPKADLRDPDVLTHAVEVIGRVEQQVDARCPTLMEPIDRAWVLVAAVQRAGGS